MANTVNGVYYAQGTNYNNGQYDDATVRRAQAYVGTTQDGMWGANSAAAAGGRSLDQIVAEMNGGNTYAAGGGYSSGASSSDLTAYLKQQAAEQLQSDLASLKNAYEKNLSVYDEQARNLPAQYEQARNDAAAQNAIAQRAFNERAAASGLNTGAGGQADLTKSAMYQQLLAQIDREEAEALQQIEAEKSRLQAEYENAIAAATSQSNASLNSNLYNELVRLQNMQAEQDALAAKLAASNTGGTAGGTGGKRTTSAETTSSVAVPTSIGGKSAAEYSAAASNYAGIKAMVNNAIAAGDKAKAKNILVEAYNTGALNLSDYSSLMNKVR